MMNYLYLSLAIIELVITLFLIKINKKNFRLAIFITLLGLLISLFILVYPLMESANLISKVITSFIYTIQTVTFNQDLSIINALEVNYFYEWIYLCLIYLSFLLIPLITTTFLLSLIDNLFSKIRLFFSPNKTKYIFSEINEKALAIASNKANKHNNIIFTINKDEQIDYNYLNQVQELHGIKLYNEVSNIKLRRAKNKRVEFYLLSDTKNNLNDAVEIINKYKNTTNFFKIFVLTHNNTDSIILDSMDKGNIQVIIVNENERMVYQLLYNKPLYLEAIKNTISVLVISDNDIGLEFIKAITWCGQLIGYKLLITILGPNASSIADHLKVNYPELLNNYNYKFIPYSLYSPQAMAELKKSLNINYVIIANTDDNKNIEYGLFFRKYFLKQDTVNYQRTPIINVMIKNNHIAQQVNLLKNEKNDFYKLNPFGSTKNIYDENYILNSQLELLAQYVHLSYDSSSLPIEVKLKKFYEKDYYVRSSRAMALHLDYKIYSLLKNEYTQDKAKNINLFKQKINNPQIFQKLIENEHDRWMAYMRTNGYSNIVANKVAIYQKITNSHIHYLAQLHPCIVPFKDLEKVAKIIDKPEIVTNDGTIIKKMVDILNSAEKEEEKEK